MMRQQTTAAAYPHDVPYTLVETTLKHFLNFGNDQARRRIEDDVESLQMRISSFIETGGRARDMADRVAVIVEDLEALKTQAVDLGQEEVKVDGYTSGTLVALVRLDLQVHQPALFGRTWGNILFARRTVLYVCVGYQYCSDQPPAIVHHHQGSGYTTMH